MKGGGEETDLVTGGSGGHYVRLAVLHQLRIVQLEPAATPQFSIIFNYKLYRTNLKLNKCR
jgi:hypothetical protein